jgi:hypothetical protein
MTLSPQDIGKQLDWGSVHTQEFRVRNISVSKEDVYTRAAAQTFEEIRYGISLQRYPHFYVINFILPLVAVTMLTIGTMWMRNAGIRMNSGTKILLCVVSIMNITAKWRPAGHGDIWLDRFQSHCLTLSMAAVLQSLVMDYVLRHFTHWKNYGYRTHVTDILLRTMICVMAILVFVADFCTVKRSDTRGLFGSRHAHSQQLLVGFVYIVFVGLGLSSACSIFWLVLPRPIWNGLLEISQTCGGMCGFSSNSLLPHSPDKLEKDERIQCDMP